MQMAGHYVVLVMLVVAATTTSLSYAHSHDATTPLFKSRKAAAAAAAAAGSAGKDFLDAHNEARAEVGVGALKWSLMLANLSSRYVRYQRDKMSCQFANLTTSNYGGNQLLATGRTVAPRDVVDEWVKEKAFYNHTDNTCVPNHYCGVYTQVVWKKSEELGCAQASCVKDSTSLTICLYNPPGNFIGQSPY